MKYNWLLFLVLLILFSCDVPEARRPVTQKTATILTEILEQSKQLIKAEAAMIESYIQKDSLHRYLTSSFGFWYKYENRLTAESKQPKTGDTVELTYNLQDIKGNIIYSAKELGTKAYKVDEEDFIPALQEGVKLMKIGETITFIIPSHRAFGLVGDQNKIGINQTLKSKVTLLNIKQK